MLDAILLLWSTWQIYQHMQMSTSEFQKQGLESDTQLIGHEEDQSDRGRTNIWISVDSQLSNSLIKQQEDGVITEAKKEVPEDREKIVGKAFTCIYYASYCTVCVLPAAYAHLNPQLHTEQRDNDIIPHLDLLIVYGAENFERNARLWGKLQHVYLSYPYCPKSLKEIRFHFHLNCKLYI